MLPTFVIGLREGVEASLIVGIIAAFLGAQGRQDALRWMWAGVALAVGLCLAIGFALGDFEGALSQKDQEALETIVALIAVGMVSYMIVWMRRHARSLRGDIESHLASALAKGSITALIVMAFLAVFREGLETAIFLLAVFQNSDDTTAAGFGAVSGLLVACIVGFALYKGGLRINMAKFFRATGVVLVLVVAGLLASAAHTAHEAAWLNAWQGEVVDLSSFIKPGSVQSALATGILGIQPKPVVAEVVAWFAAAIPLMLFVLWPASTRKRGDKREPQNASMSVSAGAVPGAAS
jgi:high-affinity iron transporter